MHLLANENFPGDAVVALRQKGHDVIWIREDSPGIPTPEYVARIAVTAIQYREDWPGHFSVIEGDRILMTPLPSRT